MPTPMDHRVLFYEDEASLTGRVSDYARDGFGAGAVMVIIATQSHRDAIAADLAAAGFDPALAASRGQLRMLDAAETLARFSTNGAIDIEAFDEVVGGVVRSAVATGRPVRAFGEMVSLLWQGGHETAAVHLEKLWDALGAHEPFDLFCAYPARCLEGMADLVHAVCDAHSLRLRACGPTVAAVPAARRFVARCIGRNQHHVRVDDALLITSELSANAVCHAKTAFLLAVSFEDGAMRIGVRDEYPALPQLKPSDSDSGSGRGIAMVDAISSRWGVDPDGAGKTVWAELPAGASALRA